MSRNCSDNVVLDQYMYPSKEVSPSCQFFRWMLQLRPLEGHVRDSSPQWRISSVIRQLHSYEFDNSTLLRRIEDTEKAL
jgi:hypothetical protein